MAIKLYWGSGSPFAWRVMLTLEIKGLAYESKLLEFSKGEHKAADYLRLNPRGKVPTLQDDDFVLYESHAIMMYLDRRYPEPPIFGSTPQETGLIWQSISETESYLAAAANNLVRPIFFGKGLDKIEELQHAAGTIRQEFKTLDQRLTHSSWLVGDRLSAADISVFPLTQLILRAANKEAAQPLNLTLLPFDQTYPHVASWIQRIEALPRYERTYPPHWRA
jgi:glutathione S-transferase